MPHGNACHDALQVHDGIQCQKHGRVAQHDDVCQPRGSYSFGPHRGLALNDAHDDVGWSKMADASGYGIKISIADAFWLHLHFLWEDRSWALTKDDPRFQNVTKWHWVLEGVM